MLNSLASCLLSLTFVEDSSSDATGCGTSLMREILSDLETIERLTFCGCSDEDDGLDEDDVVDFNELRHRLSHIDHQLERLSFHRGFCNGKARKIFFKRVERCLDLTDSHLQMWESLESTFEAVENERAVRRFFLPPNISFRPGTLQWHSWCSSGANRPTQEILAKAEREGTEIPARVHHLPRGGFTILEHWRKDVNDIVGSLLQVS